MENREGIKIPLFTIQPSSCRQPLPIKEIDYSADDKYITPHRKKLNERVLFFDPTPLYERVGHLIDPYKRHAGLQMEHVFPKNQNGICACGCGELTKAYNEFTSAKWHSADCSYFAGEVLSILNNYFNKPRIWMKIYAGKSCVECTDDKSYDLELDHIVGVKQGGGGCWLSNYRWLCGTCHKIKTATTFGHRSKVAAKKNQSKLDL